MDFARQQRNPARHLMGLAFVTLLHVGIVYLLMSGLGRHAIQVIQKPLNMKIVEEIKVTPPPEPPKPPPPKEPPPKTAPPPPPAYVPPPEVKVDVAPPPATITAQVMDKPPEAPAPIVREPVTPVPSAAPAPPAPPPAPPPVQTKVGIVCPNVGEIAADLKPKLERIAQKESIESAEVTIEIVLGPNGEIKSSRVENSSNRALNNLALAAVRNLGCKAQGREVTVLVPFSFKME